MSASDREATTEDRHRHREIARRGLIAAAWTAVLGAVLKLTSQPVKAAASLQFENNVSSAVLSNGANGPTAIYSAADAPAAYGVLSGLAYLGAAQSGLTGGSSAVYWGAPMRCGMYGYQSYPAAPSAGVYGEDWAGAGGGVVGRSGNSGLGSTVGVQGESGGGIGVRGLIPDTSAGNAIAVYGLNNSNYAGPGPGAGGFGVYGLSANGHGLVGATSSPGGAAVVGATNGVEGAYAAAFYGPVIVGGDFAVFGAKSAAVPHPDGSDRVLYCTESPESWLEDFGKAELVGGRAEVTIDPDFGAIANLADYQVLLTAYGRPQSLCVTDRGPRSFSVEARRPDATGRFSWRIAARRRDIAGTRLAPVSIPPAPTCPGVTTDVATAD